jgi:hypothetical protein
VATIYIPVEVPDEAVQQYLALASLGQVSQVEVRNQAVPTQFTRTPSEFGYQVAPQQQTQQADPWGAPATTAPSTAAPVQPAPTYSAGAAQTTPQGNPTCVHGEMRYVAAGFSRSTGKGYAAFWGCSAPRGTQQCKSVPA